MRAASGKQHVSTASAGEMNPPAAIVPAAKTRAFVFAAVAILTVASSASVLKTIFRCAKIPFAWDSAGHAWEGLIIARDILSGDIVSLAADTWRQGWWPFFHSWLLAPAFILLGNTYAAARIVSLVCFAGFAVTTYFIGLELSEKRGHWVGLAAVVLAITSLPLLVLSAMSMTEVPALLLCSIALLFYLKALRNERARMLAGASVFMAAAFFTQSHLGVFLIAAIVLTQATGSHRVFSRFNAWLFGPALAIAAVWFADPRHIWLFYNHSTFQPAFYSFWSLENWLYYPRVFLFVYHVSAAAAAVVLGGALFSLGKLREPAVRVLFFNVLVGLVLLIIKLDHRVRYTVSIVPSLWLLGSLGVVDFGHLAAGRVRGSAKRFAFVTAVCVCACAVLVPGAAATYRNYPDSLIRHEFWSDERQGPAYEFIARQAPRDCNHFAFFTSFDYYNSLKSTAIRWNLEVLRFDDELATREKKKRVMQYLGDFIRLRDSASYQRLEDFLRLRNVNVYEYHLMSFAKALDPDVYQKLRQSETLNPFSDKIADVGAIDPRVGCLIIVLRDGEDQLNRYAADFLAEHVEWCATAGKRFDDLGVTITLYHRKGASRLPDVTPALRAAVDPPCGTTHGNWH
jgi:hypothetical protein